MRQHHSIDRFAVRDAHHAFEQQCQRNTLSFRERDAESLRTSLAATPMPSPPVFAVSLRGVGPTAASATGLRPPAAGGARLMRAFHPSVSAVLSPASQAQAAAAETADELAAEAALLAYDTESRRPTQTPGFVSTVASSPGVACGTAASDAPTASSAPSATATAVPPASAPFSEPVTYFHSKQVPPLSLFELGTALDGLIDCGDEAMLVALVLMDRYCAAAEVKPTAHSMHRLYVTCLQVAIKTHCDRYLTNRDFATAAGIATAELNCCEATLLSGLQWRTLVTSEQCICFVRDALSKRDVGSPTHTARRFVPSFDLTNFALCAPPVATSPACARATTAVVAGGASPACNVAVRPMPSPLNSGRPAVVATPPLITQTPPPSPVSAAMFCEVDAGGFADPETPPNTPVSVPLRPVSLHHQPGRGLAHLRALFRPLPVA